jgi:hypothetical protein
MTSISIQGGCLCGAVRYASTAHPVAVRTCWCRVCQYFACGNASVNLAFPSATMTVTGELRDFPSTADSGRLMHRRFCPTCGVHVFSEAEERPHLIVVRAGTLDDPSIAQSDAVIWAASAPPWALLNPDIAHHDGQAPPPTLPTE